MPRPDPYFIFPPSIPSLNPPPEATRNTHRTKAHQQTRWMEEEDSSGNNFLCLPRTSNGRRFSCFLVLPNRKIFSWGVWRGGKKRRRKSPTRRGGKKKQEQNATSTRKMYKATKLRRKARTNEGEEFWILNFEFRYFWGANGIRRPKIIARVLVWFGFNGWCSTDDVFSYIFPRVADLCYGQWQGQTRTSSSLPPSLPCLPDTIRVTSNIETNI